MNFKYSPVVRLTVKELPAWQPLPSFTKKSYFAGGKFEYSQV